MKTVLKTSEYLRKTILFMILAIVCTSIISLLNKEHIFTVGKRDLISPYIFEGKVDIVFEDGTILHKKTPCAIKTNKNFKFILHLENIGMIDNKTLSFVGKNTNMNCEIDDKVIYAHFNTVDKEKLTQSNSLFLIDLPKHITNNLISIIYENSKDYERIFELKHIKIGKRVNIISNYFLEEGILNYIIFILLTIIMGIVSALKLSKNFSKKDIYFTNIAFLSFVFLVYLISNMPLSYFVLNKYEIFLHFCSYTSLMFFPILILNSLQIRSPKYVRVFLRFFVFILSLNLLIQQTLVLFNFKTFSELVEYSYLAIIITLIFTLWILFVIKKYSKKTSHVFLLSFVILALGLGFEIIFGWINGYILFSMPFKLSILIFAILELYEFFKHYIKSHDERAKMELYQKLAFIDKLTGVGNRLALVESIKDYKKANGAFFIVLMDINNLKYINDNYGHKYGDLIIELLAKTIKQNFGKRCEKEIFRIGGDEFVVVYHAPKETNVKDELFAFEDIYKKSKVEGIKDEYFGVSFGFTYCDISLGDDFEKAMHIADKNMYEDKVSKKVLNV